MSRLYRGWWVVCFLLGVAVACTQEMPPVLAPPPSENAQDAAGARAHDAAATDVESPDSGDAGLWDAAAPATDARSGDGGPSDSGGGDGSPPDAGLPAVLPDAAH